jgi:hypothetical protein
VNRNCNTLSILRQYKNCDVLRLPMGMTDLETNSCLTLPQSSRSFDSRPPAPHSDGRPGA